MKNILFSSILIFMGTLQHIMRVQGPTVCAAGPGSSLCRAREMLAERKAGRLRVAKKGRLVVPYEEWNCCLSITAHASFSRETIGRICPADRPASPTSDEPTQDRIQLKQNKGIRHFPEWPYYALALYKRMSF